MQKTGVWSLGQEDPLEKGMATHSSILAWETPWTEESGGLQSMELQRVGVTEQQTLSLLWSKVYQFSSVQLLSRVRLFATPWTTARQASLSITNSQSPPNPCPWSRWCHPTISSSVVPFSPCPQSFPASGSFPISQLFTSGGQRIGVSASTSVPPMSTQDCSPLGWTGWISLQSKGLSRVFSNTTVQKHQFFFVWKAIITCRKWWMKRIFHVTYFKFY